MDDIKKIMGQYERAKDLGRTCKGIETESFDLIKRFVNRKYSRLMKSKIEKLCEQASKNAGNDRHWSILESSVSPNICYTGGPKLCPTVWVKLLLYIHDSDEVARDEIVFSFGVDDWEKTLDRIGRMMLAGIKKGTSK